jgi:hypothetical protein
MTRQPTDAPDAAAASAAAATSAGHRLPVVATILLLAMALAGVAVLGESLGIWHLPADQANPGVYLLIAVGAIALVAALLFARRLMAALHPPLYFVLVLMLALWLFLSVGSTWLGWSLLPAS